MSKTITRKYIQRVTKREGNTNIRQSSGGGGGGGGGASQYWVEENYISKLFFNQLFTVYDEDGNVVEPNDTESVIASIKSMFGFWTDAYLSALGNGEGGGAELTLASLADVDVHGVANGQALVYDAYTQKWVPGQAGLDPTSLWQELGSLGTEQISSTHLTTALSTYNPTNNFKTINGYSIIGTGDINVGGGGGSYLPLSGGTLTGSLTINGSDLVLSTPRSSSNDSGDLIYLYGDGNEKARIWTENDYASGIGPFYRCFNSSGSLLYSGRLATTGELGNYLPLSGGTMTGTISFYNTVATNTIRFRTGEYFDEYGNIHFSSISNAWGVVDANNNNLFYVNKNGNVGVGTTSPLYKLDVNGETNINGNLRFLTGSGGLYGIVPLTTSGWTLNLYTEGQARITIKDGGNVGIGTISPSYKLHVSGVAYASTGFYSGGYVTALSDARHKDVKGDVGLTVGEVANAPSVKFLWKDRRQEGLQVGSIAQYWQKVMPEAIVKNADGELTMSYGVIALLASIATARKVENHERRIRELEEENKKLKQQLNAA